MTIFPVFYPDPHSWVVWINVAFSAFIAIVSVMLLTEPKLAMLTRIAVLVLGIATLWVGVAWVGRGLHAGTRFGIFADMGMSAVALKFGVATFLCVVWYKHRKMRRRMEKHGQGCERPECRVTSDTDLSDNH